MTSKGRVAGGLGRKRVLFTPGLSNTAHGDEETTVDPAQPLRLQALFETHPTLTAARNVLEAQLLSSGLTLKRDGEQVELTPEFRTHLDDHWMRFCKDLISSFLIAGYAVVGYEEETFECATTVARNRRGRKKKRKTGAVGNGRQRLLADNDDSGYDTEDLDSPEGSLGVRMALGLKPNRIPVVATFSSYRIAFTRKGYGFQREYRVYTRDPHGSIEPDDDAILFLRTPPDDNGHINSPMASVDAISQFVDDLMQTARLAEAGRSQPQFVTQLKKMDHPNGVATADMFFDQESREISDNQNAQSNEALARAAQMQLQLCRQLNQQMMGGSGTPGSIPNGLHGAQSSSSATQMPHNRLLTLPTDQEIAPHVPMPEIRTDLEALQRLGIDFMCTAMGTFTRLRTPIPHNCFLRTQPP